MEYRWPISFGSAILPPFGKEGAVMPVAAPSHQLYLELLGKTEIQLTSGHPRSVMDPIKRPIQK